MARDADVLVNIVNAPVSFARRYREAVRKTTQKQTNQNRFWQGLLDRPIDEAVLTGQKAWPAANDVQQGGGIA